MNDPDTFLQGLARLTADVDAYLDAVRVQQEGLSQAYRAMRIDLRRLPLFKGERLTREERLQCEAFVMAHICQQPQRTQAQIPLLHRPAVDPMRQGRGRVHQII